ncbi:3-hydroxyisobutyrate dehydrogenase [Sphingomonas quercus]|uniref:3-hydroxyisobutyrate dehydrogenase n=1 Tax=Sphingomonas quercus TaxID=2842451 RepID=A0ABS6BJN2_9SPHN|nr:3-hydroxyisobutyrate dehydrogenase [Sphingomonas quercus]MBU3078509.1 3-hydroxyisobutyrate dehydrogenase [Sphingomonas quercus]
MAVIGFIGVGNMGGGMAANLAARGHEVRAFDLSADALARVADKGCIAAGSAGEAVAGADAVVTMLPAGRHVASLYRETILGTARPDTLLIDCSTIDVDTARAVAADAAGAGFTMLDAPVSGGTAAADAGTLTFMVGGSEAGFARAEPILSAMGKAVIHAGEAGSGQAAKICNNMILGATMIATCEAFVLAEKLGLDPEKFFAISSRASGQSWSMTSYCPVPGPVPAAPSNRDFEGGFQAALMLKDLKLALDAAKSANASVPMGAQAEALYQMFAGLGGGGKDFSAIIRLLSGEWRPA